MNIIIWIMLVFFILGVIDKAIGNRFGLAEGLEKGLSQMGSLAMSMIGFYCIGVTLIRDHMEGIASLTSGLPFDLGLLPGLLLAPDMGGFPMAAELAQNKMIGMFSGILIASSIGCLLSFQLPTALNMIRSEDIPIMMRGIIPGVITMPAGLLLGGLLMGISVKELFIQMIPVFILCAALAVLFWTIPGIMEKILTAFGLAIRALGLFLFVIVILGLFWTPLKIVDDVLFLEALTVVVKITVIVCGAMTFSDLLIRLAGSKIRRCSDRFGINETSVLGLLICLTSGVAMLPTFKDMDERGKIMNSAMCVMGAYVFGGQMGFMASVVSGKYVAIYILCKLISGFLAIIAAWKMPLSKDNAE